MAHKLVSLIKIPKSSLQRKLIVQKLASREEIRQRAYAIYESARSGSVASHWLHAERERLSA
jgi:hypothetical protein